MEDDGVGISVMNCEKVFKCGVCLDEIMFGIGFGFNIVSEMVYSYCGVLVLGES